MEKLGVSLLRFAWRYRTRIMYTTTRVEVLGNECGEIRSKSLAVCMRYRTHSDDYAYLIAVNMDRKKCGMFSFRWHLTFKMLRNPNEVDVHCDRSAKPKEMSFLIKNSSAMVSLMFSQSFFEQNVCYSEYYCDC